MRSEDTDISAVTETNFVGIHWIRILPDQPRAFSYNFFMGKLGFTIPSQSYHSLPFLPIPCHVF